MTTKLFSRPLPFGMVVFFGFLLAACGPGQTPALATPEPTPTLEACPTATRTASPPAPTDTPEPAPEPRTLTICMGAELDSLFVYHGAMHAKSNVLEAIYDGPIDTSGYDYQPVILEKLPSLADGDARIEPVPVSARDRVVNDGGELVLLSMGEKVRPYGCTRPDCAIIWDG